MRRSLLTAVVVCLVVSALAHCKGRAPDPLKDDDQTYGDVVVVADEAYRSVVEAEREVFENIYPETHLRIRYMPEARLLKEMLNDTVRCVFAALKPGGEQDDWFRQRSIEAESIPILTDGIAVVANKESGITAFSLAQLKALISGEQKEPSLLNVLFDSEGSGAARTLIDSLFGGVATPLRGSAMENATAIIDRVASDPRCIGLLPFAVFSDLDNPAMRAMRERVTLCAVSRGDRLSDAVLPTQGSLADGRYPLRRTLYIILTEGKAGLGTGFVSFVAGHKGQRIILKLGLAPQKVPKREVMIVPE